MVQMQGTASATPPGLCSFLSARAPLATSPLFPGTGTPGALIPFTFPPPFLEEAPRIPQHPEMSAPCTPQCVLPALSPHAFQTRPLHGLEMPWVHPPRSLAKASEGASAVCESTAHHMLQTPVPTSTAGSYVPGAGHRPAALRACTSDARPSAACPARLRVHTRPLPHTCAPDAPHVASSVPHVHTPPLCTQAVTPTCCRCCACAHCYLTHMATCL